MRSCECRMNMTESAIALFFSQHGIMISAATISRLVTDGHGVLHEEKRDIVTAGLAASSYQQMDDTGARVQGKNHVVHVLCNPFFAAYFTRKRKDRLTVLEILTQNELQFQCNEAAYRLMETMSLPAKTLLKS